MSLDALAPDQRAVVQLVLQQDRSYDELAGLLGIPADAVRDRAHRGLERLAPGDDLSAGERGEIVDYLLGQQSVSARGSTRELLATSSPAREWARIVAGGLQGVAPEPLPDVPEPEAGDEEADEPPETPLTDTASAAADVAAPEPQDGARVPARPRPRRDRERPAALAASPPARSSRRGGALLLGAIALLLIAGIVLLVTRGGDDGTSGTRTASATPTPTPPASATPSFQPLGSLPLRAPGGGNAKGQMVVFAANDGSVAFTIQGTGVPPSRAGEAYAVWLTGGGQDHRLGFAPPVKADGRFGTSGPRASDARRFADWFGRAKAVVVARETTADASSPGPVVLRGRIPQTAKQNG